jgi:histidine triad (HIT) family protein
VSAPEDCLFCRLVAGQIPATVVAESATTLAFRDISPAAPTHVLVIPKEHFENMADIVTNRPEVMSDVMATAIDVVQREGLVDEGYRLVANTGEGGGQTVYHAHLHVLGGRGMSWPPG